MHPHRVSEETLMPTCFYSCLLVTEKSIMWSSNTHNFVNISQIFIINVKCAKRRVLCNCRMECVILRVFLIRNRTILSSYIKNMAIFYRISGFLFGNSNSFWILMANLKISYPNCVDLMKIWSKSLEGDQNYGKN